MPRAGDCPEEFCGIIEEESNLRKKKVQKKYEVLGQRESF